MPARFISSTTRTVGIITGEYKVGEADSPVDRMPACGLGRQGMKLSTSIVRLCKETLMKEAKKKSKNELLPGTLEMLILKTLSIEPMHGYGIAQHIQMLSADVLTIEEGSLYPALQRMLVKGCVLAEWKTSANNRRARFYTLTTAGKKQLGVEESRFSQMFGAIMRVMKTS
ncbi:MAG TPA: PadR family transcriptional regulator [Dehalococcoidia bacterium]